jgi:hypothetical protein
MKVFLFVLIISINSFASSSVNWGKVINSCLSEENKTEYCQNLQNYESQLNDKFNTILAQDLTEIERKTLMLAYYMAKDNISISWKVKNNIHISLSHQVSQEETKLFINYNLK